ncbi:MAG: Gfo/Idh/MocA family oxidoreductase [bacterium]|nr:Gfo/Idh/MocA family oxidoreductase [bacterium]
MKHRRFIRIGVIGAGKMALWHIRAYRMIRNVGVISIANPKSINGKYLANEYGIKQYYKDAEELINRSPIDAVDICIPTRLHAKYIKEAIMKGLHVYSEKPLCATSEEISEIINLNARYKRIIFNGFNFRFLPEFIKMRDILRSGQIGQVRYMRFLMTSESNAGLFSSQLNAGLFNEFHCHFVDLINYFGIGLPFSVRAYGTSIDKNIMNPDTGTMVLSYTDGILAEITTSDVSPGLVPQVVIIGSRATMKLRYGRVIVTNTKSNRNILGSICLMFQEAITIPHRVLRNPFVGSCRHFTDSIRNGEQSQCNEAAAYNVAIITEAAHKSFDNNGEEMSLKFYK